jgi:hypothetical protein
MDPDAANVTYGNPEAAAAPAPVADEPVSNTALNGAQVTALQGIVQAVADGLLPSETALQLIRVSFPAISEQQARAIVNPLAGFEQDKPEPKPNPFTNNGGDDNQNDDDGDDEGDENG